MFNITFVIASNLITKQEKDYLEVINFLNGLEGLEYRYKQMYIEKYNGLYERNYSVFLLPVYMYAREDVSAVLNRFDAEYDIFY